MNKEVIIPGLYSPREVATPKCNDAFANKIEFISRNNFVNKADWFLNNISEPTMIHPGALIVITSRGDISIPMRYAQFKKW